MPRNPRKTLLNVGYTVLTALTLTLPTGSMGSTLHPAEFHHVVDGDNMWLTVQTYLEGKTTDNFRLNGLDTPESTWRAKCAKEKALGNTAKATLDGIMEAADVVVVEAHKRGKFGRPLVTVFADGESVNDKMIELKLARPYKGDKKSDWCN